MIDFIIHSEEGKRKVNKARKAIEKRLSTLNIPYCFHFTERKGHATELARELVKNGADCIVAVGGDGTVHETLNGLDCFDRVTFGIIPAGTGNDFAASVNIPTKPLKALDIILQNNVKRVDFFECSGIRGMNAIGAGIDVDILKHYNKHTLNGKIQYTLSLLHCLIHYRPYELTVIDKNGVKHAKKVLIACLCNGKRFGGGIKISPDSIVDDGKLDFLVVNDLPKRKFIGALIKLATGKIKRISTSESSLEENVKIEGSFPVQIDGEIYENIAFDVKIVKDTLKMYLPK